MNDALPAFSVRDIEVRRGNRCLVAGVDFELNRGQAAVVTGANGTGKTSLLRILAGLVGPTRGDVRWQGVQLRALPFEQRHEIAYRSHSSGLKQDLSVRENLDFYAALWMYGASTDGILDELGLDSLADRRMGQLSAGQKRRLTLATLKVAKAILWILDEPLTNLDEAGRSLIAQWVDAHVAEGGIALIATHQPAEFRCASLAIEL